MSNCRKQRTNTQCGTTTVQEPSQQNACDPINVCLSFGRSLVWSGNCPEVRGQPTIEDGWYGQVQVVDGCIVDAREAALQIYTPAPCAPAASPCSEGSGGGSVALNPEACNLLTMTSGMLSARLYFGDSSGVTVSGCGTQNDPLVLTASSSGGSTTYVKSGSPMAIGVEGDGSLADPFTISLTTVDFEAGWHGVYEIDTYGRITGYDASRGGVIEGVSDGDGIKLSVDAGVLTADLLDLDKKVSGQYTTGGYTYTIDQKGRVTAVRRDIEIDEDTYQLGAYKVTVNAYGSITGIAPVNEDNTAIPDTFVGSFRGQAGSADNDREMTFTTDLDGPLHVEYRGALGTTTLEPGVYMTVPAGYAMAIDGTAMPDQMIEVAGGSNGNTIISIRATTMNSVAAGQHTVTVSSPTSVVTQKDGFIRAQIVGRGS